MSSNSDEYIRRQGEELAKRGGTLPPSSSTSLSHSQKNVYEGAYKGAKK